MSKQWLGRVSVALSLVRAIYSYRRSQLPQRLRALQLLTWILWLRRQMFHPSPPELRGVVCWWPDARPCPDHSQAPLSVAASPGDAGRAPRARDKYVVEQVRS
jgi:hypothetical protein